MKAKIKATGEVYKIVKVLGLEVLLSDGNVYDYTKVEYITEPDWQHYRIQAAIAAMQAYVIRDSDLSEQKVAKYSVEYADELVKQLKGE